MKKKYSTFLNFALATCVATALVACSDGDYTGPDSRNQSPKLAMLQGFVLDTNGNPIAGATAATQGKTAVTDAAGMYTFTNLLVTNTSSVDHGDDLICITVHVEPPDSTEHLNGWVDYCPMAEIDGMQDAGEGLDNGNSLTLTNPLVTFIDNYIAEASPAILPELSSTVEGRLEYCDTGESAANVALSLDFESVSGDCGYGFCYSTAMYNATTDEDGMFSFANIPDDSTLRLFAPKYTNNSGADHLTHVSTGNEGLVFIGDVCVDPIIVGDGLYPCVKTVKGVLDGETYDITDTIYENDEKGIGNVIPTLNGHARLNDNIDGTVGKEIEIVFTETMQPAPTVNENSIVIWDDGPNHSDPKDDAGYITDFTAAVSGNTLTITTADPIGDDHYLEIYLLKSDFKDTAGNWLTMDAWSDAAACDFDPSYTNPYQSNNGTLYVQVNLKIFSQDSTNVGEATDLTQVCLDQGGDAGLEKLNDEYPSVFSNQGAPNTSGMFNNLNADDDYEYRLEALADVVGAPSANIVQGGATVAFIEPSSGQWEASIASSNEYATVTGTVASDADGSANSVVVTNGVVGDVVFIASIDDFGNYSNVAEIELVDCVAPTTVLNYAYNTCGHLGGGAENPYVGNSSFYHTQAGGSGPGYDTDYAAHICAAFADAGFLDFGDGGEDAGAGLPGNIAIPTLNITCRLFKDQDAAGMSGADGITVPTFFYGLQTFTLPTGIGTAFPTLYNATEWAAYPPVSDTIGVAFSEDIEMVAGAMPELNPTFIANETFDAEITSWTVNDNVTNTDDANGPYGGIAPEGVISVDLAQITVDDVFTLANMDHGGIIDFTNAVTDDAGNAADNANVVVNDLLPPMVEYAYWIGDMVIKFNEAVDPDLSDNAGSPTADTDFVSMYQPRNTSAHPTVIYLNGATLSADGMTLTIPAANLGDAGVTQDDLFPSDDSDTTTEELVYDENIPAYRAERAAGPYGHGILAWDHIPDANGGNMWVEWESDGHTDSIFLDIDGNEICMSPLFAVADLVGPFSTSVGALPATFADDQPATCGTAGSYGSNPSASTNSSFSLQYNFSHPVSLEQADWPGATCAGDPCLLTEVNNFMNDVWVDNNVFFTSLAPTYSATPLLSVTELTGVGAQLTADRMTIDIQITNGLNADPCWRFQAGDALNPEWFFSSSYGVGTAQDLNAQSAK